MQKCKCGCGNNAPVPKGSDRSKGYVKGVPLDFCKGHHLRQPLEDRLWEKIACGGPDECWPWTGSTVSKGYGSIGHEGKTLSAHRVVWQITNGDPGNLHVLHWCDNPPCCNPAHLFLGTNADNQHDRLRKERWRKSDRLNADLVRAIRSAYDPVINTHRELAEMFDVSPATIGLVIQKKIWTHVDPEWHPPSSDCRPWKKKRRYLNDRADELASICMDEAS